MSKARYAGIQIRHDAFTHVKQAIDHMVCYLPGDLHHHPCSGKPPRLQRAICFNRHGYFFVCLYWTGFGLPANIVEVYILLSIVSAHHCGPQAHVGLEGVELFTSLTVTFEVNAAGHVDGVHHKTKLVMTTWPQLLKNPQQAPM